MNNNFDSVVWIAGHFGICIREHVEELVYRNKYSQVSANRTLAKLVNEYKYLKRIDRGKMKTNGYKLTPNGVKRFRELFGYEPKVYNSGDKLSHSIKLVDFYVNLIRDNMKRGLIKDDFNLIEESRKFPFQTEKQIKFFQGNKDKVITPDAFCIYRYAEKRGKIFHLEIENSDRRVPTIANKILSNYESYFLSSAWKKEKWQSKDKKHFPPILVVTYSEHKARQIMTYMANKAKTEFIKYYFSDYISLDKEGFGGKIWYNMNGEKVTLI